ncbi:MAG: arginase [Inquilinaceae bacterium]
MTSQPRPVALIGAATSEGSGRFLGAGGPAALRAYGLADRLTACGRPADWDTILASDAAPEPLVHPADALPRVAAFNRRVADAVAAIAASGRLPVTIGGDHSYAIGHYAGMTRGLPASARAGLLWIDAHADCNTVETSPSGACHGMTLAATLGIGHPDLTVVNGGPSRIDPAHVALIGPRAIDAGERTFLSDMGLRLFAMDEIARRGLDAVMDEALDIVALAPSGFGLSIDLDAVDPTEAPAVAVPEPGGLSAAALIAALTKVAARPGLLGIELAEYVPELDPPGHPTADLAARLLESALCGPAPG